VRVKKEEGEGEEEKWKGGIDEGDAMSKRANEKPGAKASVP
jgi:hypothetical protein